MRKRSRVLGKKGQITLPAEMRRALNLAEGDKVAVTREGNVIHVARVGSVVEQTAGIIKKRHRRPPTVKEMKAAAEQAMADDAYQRTNQ